MHRISRSHCLKPCWMSQCLLLGLWDLNVSLAGNPLGAGRGCANTLTMSVCVWAHGFSYVSHNALFWGRIMGLCGPLRLVMQRGVTCVCHKWALVWLIALWMSPVQPLSARHPLAVVCIVFLPLAEAAAADFLTKKENELFSPRL